MAHNTEHFKVSEFTCKCGCGTNIIDQKVIDMAETIRQELGVPVHVNSGCRCKNHNKNVGGTANSKHVLGKACDLSCSQSADAMFGAVKKLHAEGNLNDLDYCILYKRKNFIHIDCGGKRKSLWEVRP